MSLAVFAYGSLVSPDSAAETLGRPVAPRPARLRNWRRDWSLARDNAASEKTFALADGTRPAYCLGLNLRPDAGAPGPNGALIALDERELERLDLRELRYDRVEVAAAIDPPKEAQAFEAVFVYTAKRSHHRPEPPAGSIVIASYLSTVESAFAEFGSPELELFRATTATPPVPVAEAILIEDRIPPGNPRRW